jgi:hypothetical protein
LTAFPVLARILTDRGLQKTPIGMLVLTCAAIDDVTAWCLLALLVGVAQRRPETPWLPCFSQSDLSCSSCWSPAAEPNGLCGGRLPLVTPRKKCWQWFVPRRFSRHWQRSGLGFTLFGAFLVGVVIPHDSELALDIRNRMQT